MAFFLLTNDVELTSIPLNREFPSLAEKIYKVGLPRLLDLYSKYGVKSTFYFTGNFAKIKPEALELVKKEGHEIGCHGYSHNSEDSFDIMDYEKQIEHLVRAKKVIENIVGKITAFRAPELRINKYTVKALEATGFKTDSSVAPQRFDGPMSSGMKEKIKWLFAPRTPYYLSYDSPFKKGKSSILEIPISAAIIPYIGTMMRISPALVGYLEKYLFYEARQVGKPIVFIFHPNECLSKCEMERNNSVGSVSNRGGNWFADVLRPKLKCRNLGIKSISLLEEIIKRAKLCRFKFITVREFSQNYKGEK